MMNITTLLDMGADAMGDRIVFGTKAEGYTYGEVVERAKQVARVVAGTGAERLVFVGINSPQVPVLLYGAALAGVPFVPLNYRLADDRLRSLCERTAPALVVADADVVPRIQGIDGVTVVSSEQMAALEEADPEADLYDPEMVAVWLFTSGTTGEPKAAILRHRHLSSYVLSTVEFMGAAEDEAQLVSVPPYHIAGMSTILSNAYSGRRVVYLPQFEPKEWVQTALDEGITHAMVVPTMLGRILDAMEEMQVSLPALRHLAYGGGRMPVPTIERALSMLPEVGFVNAYGLTETSSTIAVLGPDDHRTAAASDDPAVRARLGSVGQPLPILELEIRDEAGAPVAAGEAGEIWVRGEQVSGEYQGRSVLNDEGWFLTNDAGRLDEHGFLYVEGRLDDVIVRGGENMSPGEIEDVLIEHPGIDDVCVTGVHDDEWGEAVAVVIVRAPGATVTDDEVRELVRSKLRSSRVPSIVEFRDELPYNETGKLLRRMVKAELDPSAG